MIEITLPTDDSTQFVFGIYSFKDDYGDLTESFRQDLIDALFAELYELRESETNELREYRIILRFGRENAKGKCAAGIKTEFRLGTTGFWFKNKPHSTKGVALEIADHAIKSSQSTFL